MISDTSLSFLCCSRSRSRPAYCDHFFSVYLIDHHLIVCFHIPIFVTMFTIIKPFHWFPDTLIAVKNIFIEPCVESLKGVSLKRGVGSLYHHKRIENSLHTDLCHITIIFSLFDSSSSIYWVKSIPMRGVFTTTAYPKRSKHTKYSCTSEARNIFASTT